MATVAVLALLSFEIGSQYLYWLETGKLFLMANRSTAAQVVGTADITTKIHPYFGFMYGYSQSFIERNGQRPQNVGFVQAASYARQFSGCCDFPMRPEDHQDKFIVSVIGNSVAMGIAQLWQVSPDLHARLSGLAAAKGKKVLILNLAHGGYHQPQYLMVLSYLLSIGTKLDLILYFATVNDVVASVANVENDLAAEFRAGTLPLCGSAIAARRSCEWRLAVRIPHVTRSC